MKTRAKRILPVLSAVFVLGASGVVWLGHSFLSPNSSRNRASAIEATLTWGRLAPFPLSVRQFAISTQGSMFTRAFRASFVASAADIEQWLQQSPGTREVSPETSSPGLRHFQIAPGGGAQHAELTVEDTHHRVSIYVYWS